MSYESKYKGKQVDDAIDFAMNDIFITTNLNTDNSIFYLSQLFANGSRLGHLDESFSSNRPDITSWQSYINYIKSAKGKNIRTYLQFYDNNEDTTSTIQLLINDIQDSFIRFSCVRTDNSNLSGLNTIVFSVNTSTLIVSCDEVDELVIDNYLTKEVINSLNEPLVLRITTDEKSEANAVNYKDLYSLIVNFSDRIFDNIKSFSTNNKSFKTIDEVLQFLISQRSIQYNYNLVIIYDRTYKSSGTIYYTEHKVIPIQLSTDYGEAGFSMTWVESVKDPNGYGTVKSSCIVSVLDDLTLNSMARELQVERNVANISNKANLLAWRDITDTNTRGKLRVTFNYQTFPTSWFDYFKIILNKVNFTTSTGPTTTKEISFPTTKTVKGYIDIELNQDKYNSSVDFNLTDNDGFTITGKLNLNWNNNTQAFGALNMVRG